MPFILARFLWSKLATQAGQVGRLFQLVRFRTFRTGTHLLKAILGLILQLQRYFWNSRAHFATDAPLILETLSSVVWSLELAFNWEPCWGQIWAACLFHEFLSALLPATLFPHAEDKQTSFLLVSWSCLTRILLCLREWSVGQMREYECSLHQIHASLRAFSEQMCLSVHCICLHHC